MTVAIVHDYLTQRGGAERVVLSMLRAFPDAPVYTSFFDPDRTFPEFATADIRPLRLNRLAILRRRHRLAFPFLAQSFSSLEVDADVVLCSSSGWAHGVGTPSAKIVYCHSPARWLYEPERYWGGSTQMVPRLALAAARPRLLRWDRRAAGASTRYLTVSQAARAKIHRAYGIDPEVVYPPPGLTVDGPEQEVEGLGPGYYLCVARMLAYKNISAVIDAFAGFGERRLVVVGAGPEARRLRRSAPGNVRFLGAVSDAHLRWLYANAAAVVSAAYDDLGLTPLEAASFAKPSIALRAEGSLETVLDGETGVFFDAPSADAIRAAVERASSRRFDERALRTHALRFSEAEFISRLRAVVAEAAAVPQNGHRTPVPPDFAHAANQARA